MEVITNLVEETIRSMREVGLVESHIKTLGHTWNAFGRWLAEKGLSYDPPLGWTFLSEEYGIEGPGGRSKTRAEQIRRRAVTALESCHEHRPWRRVKDRQYFPRFRESHRPVLERFLESMEGRLSDSTVCGYVHMLNRLSPYLADRGIDDIAHVDQPAIVGFMGSIADSGVGQGLVYATACRLRRLLAWLELSGFVRQGLASAVPKVRTPQPEPPDTYTAEEVASIIGAIDTAGPTGKRNLVICLLAARLGMRSSDTVGLRFENLKWREGVISFASAKTGTPTVLPLTNEVGGAIIDYLKNGRPESDEPFVLLRHDRPHARLRPASIHGIVSAAMVRAGLARDGRRRGAHALRASLATRMMDGGVPLPVISQTLSHESSETTRAYLARPASIMRTRSSRGTESLKKPPQ